MFLLEWFLEVIQTCVQIYWDNFSPGGPARSLGRRLRIMYGRGEIDQKTFFKLRDSLIKGYYIAGELQACHEQAQLRLQREGHYSLTAYDSQISHSLERVYLQRAMLDEARLEMQQAQQTLQAQSAWMEQQANALRQEAQRALPDEDAARAYLSIRQDLLERVEILSRRTGDAQRTLRQLDMLQAELGVSEAELLLVDSQEHYAKVKLAMHQ